MQKKQQIGYDDTKRMLNILRKLNESKSTSNVLKEQEEIPQEKSQENLKNDITVINDTDVKLQSGDGADLKLTDEQKKSISEIIDSFRQTVSNLAEFEPGISINPEQIRMDGNLPEIDTSFTIVAGQNTGLYTTSQMTKITQDVIDMYGKLNKFYQIYIDAMNPIITQRKNN